MKIYSYIRKVCFKIIFCLLSVSPANYLYAQSQLPQNVLQVGGGYSRHGSGDMNGIVFGTEYTRYISKRFSLNYNFRASINNSKDVILFRYIFGIEKDASIRFTTAGIQLGVNGQYSIIRGRIFELITSLGAFGRYQSASNGSDGYSLYYPNSTNLPPILIGYDNRTPQKTYSVGGIVQFYFLVTLPNQLIFGAAPGFQTDTNGDAIPQIVLIMGRRF